MGLFDRFRKKTEEEEFFHAIESKDYVTVVKLGKALISKYPNSISIVNSYSDALIKLGKKKEAIEVLLNFTEEKIREEYFDVAVAMLKKVLRIDPFEIRALKLLISVYRKKGLFYEAFKTLEEAYWRFLYAGKSTSTIKSLLENFIEGELHPLFFEKFAEILKAEENSEDAYTNYILAGNLYMNLKNYKSALRAFLKAREIKRTTNLDKQILDVVVNEDGRKDVVLKLIIDNSSDFDFLKYLISVFKTADKLSFLKQIIENISDPKIKFFLSAMIEFELGEVENGLEFMEKLKFLDKEAYNKLLAVVSLKYPGYSDILKVEETTLPDPEDILEVLEQAIDVPVEIQSSFNEIEEFEKEKSKDIDKEVKNLELDGSKYISMAEAMLGLGQFDKAIENARKALMYEDLFFRASILLATTLKMKGNLREALDFLVDILNTEKLTEDEKAKLKKLLGEVYEDMGNEEKALIWYKEAYKTLREPELKCKIDELEKKAS
ncbi:Tetratricopeptide TPR_1 repeat-containing protein [Desulfurobacterium thermolithotrophum DSM 11699]|uniref:Tetratricopeptide TPR_1 repeat-containing protein n=1 Tax=Desulfurobacterium thermolithotrophum (strain DSM 11699 / BSA) TaxID=868864 RepID=F0S1L7_DESTD|nr:hypothetical protein [Desulfurobacterium thermolithotrophum]ADY74020.1 Tetratricopeptide TPR_1 repeat-containing protein [Desulfurobacterium thermolithotrophum DSM 11699]